MVDPLEGLRKDAQIYCVPFVNSTQKDEIEARNEVSSKLDGPYLDHVSRHHSIPVMDREVRRFLSRIPRNGSILDVGGCWGWHWRNIAKIRSDVKVYILDFAKKNLEVALNVMDKESLNKQIYLVHGDATGLPFPDRIFDGYWSVQTLQHISAFEIAINEACRVLKTGGYFSSYSLNNQLLIRLIYRLLGRKYHVKGRVSEAFYLERLSQDQIGLIENIFGARAEIRYSEILFKPELKFTFSGKENLLGNVDSLLSNSVIFKSVARQASVHLQKNKS